MVSRITSSKAISSGGLVATVRHADEQTDKQTNVSDRQTDNHRSTQTQTHKHITASIRYKNTTTHGDIHTQNAEIAQTHGRGIPEGSKPSSFSPSTGSDWRKGTTAFICRDLSGFRTYCTNTCMVCACVHISIIIITQASNPNVRSQCPLHRYPFTNPSITTAIHSHIRSFTTL